MPDFVTFGDISPRVGIHAVSKLLERLEPKLVLDKFGRPEPLPKNKGEVIKWRRLRPLPVNTAQLVEGVTPAPNQLVYEDVTTVIAQFGGWIELTDKIMDLHEDRVLDDAMTVLSDQVANTKEMILWGVLKGGTQVFYANGTDTSAVNTPVDAALVQAAVTQLKRNLAEKITTKISSSTNFNTENVNPSYVLFAHVDLEHDFRQCDGFVPVENYGSGKLLDPDAEIGKLNEVRILLSPQLAPLADGGGATTTMRSTSNSNADVYSCILVGKNAYGTVPLQGVNGINMVVNNAKIGASSSDPLGQRPFVAWKIWYQAVRLNELWMARLEVAATALS